MTVSAHALAVLCSAIYDGPAGFVRVWARDDVVIGLARVDDVDVLVLRGSATAADWLRDIEALPAWHDQLGYCHAGFLVGMDDVFADVRGAVGPRLVITGHSLGGARARILAALFATAGISVEQLCVFGSPKPGFINLARVIQKSGMVHASYRNRNDVVPLMPGLLPVWAHTEAWAAIDAAPASADLAPLRDHSCALYAKALERAI